jgi:hypothetical protein
MFMFSLCHKPAGLHSRAAIISKDAAWESIFDLPEDAPGESWNQTTLATNQTIRR